MTASPASRAFCRIAAACLAVLAQCCPALAQSCDKQLALAKSWASSLQVRLNQANVTVGSLVDISWQTLQTLPASSDTQVHLVFGVGQEARLGKTGFFALTPGAKAPSNIAFASNTTRAYFPVQRLGLRRGDFSLTSLRNEMLAVSWAVVLTGSTCGELIAGGGSGALEVTAGWPELVIQDAFATERPLAQIRSLSGKYDLLQFKERYEVHDVATGAKLIERAGVDANFSPTSRFLVGRKGTDRSLEIIDLLSRQVVASVPDSILVWLRNDSYVISAWNQWGGVIVQNTIVDGEELLRFGASCHACTAWDYAQVEFNMDKEYVAVFGNQESAATDLVAGRTFKPEQIGDEAKAAVLAHLQQQFADPRTEFPKTWQIGEKLAISHTDMSNTGGQFLVRHRKVDNRAARAAANDTLVGSSAIRDIQPTAGIASTARLAAEQLRSLGIDFLPNEPMESLFIVDAASTKQGLKNPKLMAVANQMKVDAPSSASLFTTEKSPCMPDMPLANEISRIYSFKSDGAKYWLVQAGCVAGSGAFPYSAHFLVGTRYPAPVQLKVKVNETRDLLETEGYDLVPFQLSRGLLGVGIVGESRVALFDIKTGQLVGQSLSATNVNLLSELYLLRNGTHLLQINKDGSLAIFAINGAKKILSGAIVDGEVVIADDAGRYDTSYEGASFVQLRFPGMPGLYNFRQFEKRLFEPGLAARLISDPARAMPAITISAPPTVRFTAAASAKDGVHAAKVMIEGSSELAEVRVYIDGHLDRTLAANGKIATFDFAFPALGGGRSVSVVASDQSGLLSLPSSIKLPGAPAKRGALRAIAVGVDTYSDAAITKLNFAESDANKLAHAIQGSAVTAFNSVSVRTLVNGEVSPDRVLAAVREAAAQTGPDDTLIFSFAGHAIGGAAVGRPDVGLMLATSVSRLNDLPSTSVKWSDLTDVVATARGKLIFILDACHAGLAGSEKFGTNDEVVSSLFTRSGGSLVVLAASKGRQFSLEDPAFGGGLFTSAIVEVLTKNRALYDTDHSGLVDLSELYRGVKQIVMQKSQNEQTPWLARNGIVGDLSLF